MLTAFILAVALLVDMIFTPALLVKDPKREAERLKAAAKVAEPAVTVAAAPRPNPGQLST